MDTKKETAIFNCLAEVYEELDWEWTLAQASPAPAPRSEQFQNRMEKILRKSRVREVLWEIGEKAACILLVLAIGTGLLLLSDKEVRAELIRFFRKDWGTHTTYEFPEKVEWEGEFELYEPTWVPEGFVEADRWIGEISGMSIRYDKVQGDEIEEIYFGCTDMRYAGISLNTENTKCYEVTYKGERAEFYESQDEAFLSSFVWQNQSGCWFDLGGNLTLEEFMKIADSLEKTEDLKNERKK